MNYKPKKDSSKEEGFITLQEFKKEIEESNKDFEKTLKRGEISQEDLNKVFTI